MDAESPAVVAIDSRTDSVRSNGIPGDDWDWCAHATRVSAAL